MPNSSARWKRSDDLGVAQERLGRNAPPVEADAARPIVLHRGHGEAELRAADRRHVAAGPGADDDDVERLAHRRVASVARQPCRRSERSCERGAAAPRAAASRPGGSARPWRRPSRGGRRRSSSSCAGPRRARPCPRRASRRTEPTARMAPSGGLMMAENSSTSYMPRLEMRERRAGHLLARAACRPARARPDHAPRRRSGRAAWRRSRAAPA